MQILAPSDTAPTSRYREKKIAQEVIRNEIKLMGLDPDRDYHKALVLIGKDVGIPVNKRFVSARKKIVIAEILLRRQQNETST